jgi:hypothetical protein
MAGPVRAVPASDPRLQAVVGTLLRVGVLLAAAEKAH